MITPSGLTAKQEYATLGDKESPSIAEIEQGVVPLQTLPAEWFNFYMQMLTAGLNTTKGDVDKLSAELSGMLTAAGITPNASITTQMATLLSRIPYGDNAYASTLITDANAITKSGLYRCTTTAANVPNAEVYVIWQISFDQNECIQLAVSTSAEGNFYFRRKYYGEFRPWRKVWNADNDGSGSGLDADTVDGIDSTRIIFGSDVHGATEVAYGDLNTVVTKTGFYRLSNTVTNIPFAGRYYNVIAVVRSAEAGTQIAHDTASNFAWIRSKSSGVWTAWALLWSSANDGAGSGLDAESLQGLPISISGGAGAINLQVAATCYNVANCNNVIGNGIFFQTTNTAANTPVANQFFTGIQFYRSDNEDFKHQFGYCSGAYWRRMSSSEVWQPWYKVYDGGSVGANWPAALTAALGTGWTTALAAPAVTIPSVTSDPSSPVNGQMWLRSDL